MEIKKVRKTVDFDFKMRFKYGDAVDLLQVGELLYLPFPGIVAAPRVEEDVKPPVEEKKAPPSTPPQARNLEKVTDDVVASLKDVSTEHIYTDAELKAMTVPEIGRICMDLGVVIPRDNRRNTNKRLRSLVLSAQRVSGDDGQPQPQPQSEPEVKPDAAPDAAPNLVDLEGNEYMHGEKITVVSQAGDYQATVDGLVTVDEDNNVITDGSHGNTYVKLAMPGDGEDCFDSFYKLKFRGWE